MKRKNRAPYSGGGTAEIAFWKWIKKQILVLGSNNGPYRGYCPHLPYPTSALSRRVRSF